MYLNMIQLLLLFLFLPKVCSIVELYKLNLTSSAPAVYGSKIVFKAELYMNTGEMPKDPKRFKYEWKRTGSTYVETTYANFNSSLHSCYSSQSVFPGQYKMKVNVFETQDIFRQIARKSINFDITDTLNGNIGAQQNVTHVSNLANNNTFSTHKEIHLHVNLSDLFPEKPSLSYYWSIDNAPLVGQNKPDLIRNFTKPGRHKVSAVAVVNQPGFQDCAGNNYSQILNGSFSTVLILKDPVGDYIMFGKQETYLGGNITLTVIWQRGSGPFNFTWTVESVNDSKVLNHSSHICDNTSANVTIGSSVLTETGHYWLNISIDNGISLFHRAMQLTIKSHSSASFHSPVIVVMSVIGGLIIMTVGLIIYLRVVAYRARGHHIETADFDFHPQLSSDRPSDPSARWSLSSWFTPIVEKLKRLREARRKNYVVTVGENDTHVKRMLGYGSLGNSTEDSWSSYSS